MKFQLFFIAWLLIFLGNNTWAQSIAINTNGAAPENSALLDVNSTTKGVLIPRMSMAQRDSINSPATGLLIYQTNNNSGYYFYNGSIWTSMTSGVSGSIGHYIGEYFGGGLVYYVYDNGSHGLIASLDDLSQGIGWGNPAINISNSESEYDGAVNSISILSQLGTGTTYAARLCINYNAGGYSDWYLPSIWELNLLYNDAFMISSKLNSDGNPATNGFLLSSNYWSSTERSTTEAWHVNFGFDYQFSNNDKNMLHRVRAIRRF